MLWATGRRLWWGAGITLMMALALGLGIALSEYLATTTAPLKELAAQISDPEKRLAAEKDLLQYQTDNQIKLWTTIVQAVGAFVLGVGGYFTWRNLLVTQERLDVDRQAQITNRFTQAIGQLGAELKDGAPNLEVRLGGIYALERIARDSPRDHGTIMEVLTAYVRQNAGSRPAPVSTDEAPHLRVDIQAVLTVLGRRDPPAAWQELARLDLRDTDLRRASLSNTVLENAILYRSHLEEAILTQANLAGAGLYEAHLERAVLDRACLRDANLIGAHLEQAHLYDGDLEGASLIGAHLEQAALFGARLAGADLLEANLSQADLTRADLSSTLNITMEQVAGAHQQGQGASLPLNWPSDWRDRFKAGT
jgi:uncharacterized protein YjbI with pentapeptide repeats